MCKIKTLFVYDSHFKCLHQTKCCWDLIDNRADAPSCVLDDIDIKTKLKIQTRSEIFLGGLCTVEYVYKINPC